MGIDGHLFVSRGDLTALACDAWLLPVGLDRGRYGHHGGNWALPARVRQLMDSDSILTVESPDDRVRVRMLLAAERRPTDDPDPPAVWAGHTGPATTQEVDWYALVSEEFVRRAGRAASATGPLFGRVRPLLAFPLVGAGLGGRCHDRGGLVKALLETAHRAASTEGVDVAFVAANPEAFAAAQRARDDLVCWPERSPDEEDAVEKIGARAREDRLVVFVGAGVSRGQACRTGGVFSRFLPGTPR